VSFGAACALTVGCSGGSSGPAATTSSFNPILASPTSSSDYLNVTWNEDGIVWTVADPDGQYWERSVPGADLSEAQRRACGETVVENLEGMEPGTLQLPPGAPHDLAVAAAVRWCGRTTGTTTQRQIGVKVLRELGLPVETP
jgi:hypothetical protein